jgi:hypothetical protein
MAENPITTIIHHLFTRNDYAWIDSVDNGLSFVVFVWLCMIDEKQVSDALVSVTPYIFHLEGYQCLMMMHSVIHPKRAVVPRFKYIKPNDVDDSLECLYDKMRKTMGYSEREFEYVRHYIDPHVRANLLRYFNDYCIDPEHYKTHKLKYPHDTNRKKPRRHCS